MKCLALRDTFYPPNQQENDTPLVEMVAKAAGPDSRLLDAGAGAGVACPYEFKGKVAEMVGIDLDPRVVENPCLDRGVKGDLCDTPFEDSYFDIVFCRYVLEHVDEPEAFAREVARILTPGGRFMFLTPSKWHYVSLIATLTPDFFHEWYNEKLRGRVSADTFPTRYKLNSAGDLRRVFTNAGFREEAMVFREISPNYFLWSKVLFFCGMVYERIVNRFGFLSPFRANIIGCFVKSE